MTSRLCAAAAAALLLAACNGASAKPAPSESVQPTESPPATTAPGPPGKLALGALTSDSAEISWSSPEGDRTITSYEVQWRPAAAPDWSNAASGETAGNETSYTLSGLEPDTWYLARVRAAIDQASDWSHELELKTEAVATTGTGNGNGNGNGTERAVAPPAPTGIGARPTSDTTVRVTWDAPQATAAVITGYRVRWRTGSDSWRSTTGLAPDAESFDIGGLSAGTTYEVQVQAVAGTVTSEWSPAPAPVTTTVPTGILPEVRITNDDPLYVAQSTTESLVFGVQARTPVTSDLDVELTVLVEGAMVTVAEGVTIRTDDTATLTILAAETASNELRVNVDPDAAATDSGSVWVALNPNPAAYTAGTPISALVIIVHER